MSGGQLLCFAGFASSISSGLLTCPNKELIDLLAFEILHELQKTCNVLIHPIVYIRIVYLCMYSIKVPHACS